MGRVQDDGNPSPCPIGTFLELGEGVSARGGAPEAAAVGLEEELQFPIQQFVTQAVDERVHHARRFGEHCREHVPVER